ncbi:hypothetical protein B0T19DRAFT_136206 [Cercophora scortea]|uniref:Uncharacterized protein n=1 Tax=Cercophora scortea TaxID=314031 RepID=A0AAE0MJB8_9PEZI|nr:hypothetical protein B0T19DRAFT_136206 [Cercophora scortea]
MNKLYHFALILENSCFVGVAKVLALFCLLAPFLVQANSSDQQNIPPFLDAGQSKKLQLLSPSLNNKRLGVRARIPKIKRQNLVEEPPPPRA